MSGRLATHAVASLAALDLRRAPDHASEMRSQLLLGEVVRRLGQTRDGSWWRVENQSDGYRGWVRTWGLVPASATRAASWAARARARVTSAALEATALPGGGVAVGPLFWNSRVIAGRARGRWRAIELPDGRRGWVEAAGLGPTGRPDRPLIDRVRGLLGVPYLWGGRTSAGLDCSGFVQQVYSEQGTRLPRDAREQSRVGRKLGARETKVEGDLLFFGLKSQPIAHVALALGAGYFAHARGMVRINSTDPDNVLYDKALMDQFRFAKRIK